MSHNKLTSLPAEFSNLQRLADIDLSFNELGAVPGVLRSLKTLTSINLSCNNIEEVSKEDYDSLHSLEVLNLKDNPLREEVRILLQSIVRLNIIM